MANRKYTPRKRAEQQQETRRRIVAAAIALHEQVGPRQTTIKAVAEKAGVQRLTVYRHFPNEDSLFDACTSHWLEQNPLPEPAAWAGETDPAARSRAAFRAFYTYYRGTRRMWTRAYQDAAEVPSLRPKMDEVAAYLDAVRDQLAEAWPVDKPRRGSIRALVGHCLQFSTWASLDREGLSDDEMAEFASVWLTCLADGGGRRT